MFLRNLYSEPDVISEIKKERLRWSGNDVGGTSEERNVKKVLRITRNKKSLLETQERDV